MIGGGSRAGHLEAQVHLVLRPRLRLCLTAAREAGSSRPICTESTGPHPEGTSNSTT